MISNDTYFAIHWSQQNREDEQCPVNLKESRKSDDSAYLPGHWWKDDITRDGGMGEVCCWLSSH